MTILIITPAPPRSLSGNRITALRWARILRGLGHRVRIEQEYRGQTCDLMVALHALKSAESVTRYIARHPNRPLIVALTGTDLYGDLRSNAAARRSVDAATRLVALQPLAPQALPKNIRAKVRIIRQSARKPRNTPAPRKDVFEGCVIGHLRPVKDPFRAAMAVRRLPQSSRIVVTHIGAALSKDMDRRARGESHRNPNYHWMGGLPRWKTLRLLGRSRLMVLSSKTEGGANVLSEAIAASVPIVATRIAGSIGILGEDYPGYFPVGNTTALKDLLLKIESDAAFYRSLKQWCRRLRPLINPRREQAAWASLIGELL